MKEGITWAVWTVVSALATVGVPIVLCLLAYWFVGG